MVFSARGTPIAKYHIKGTVTHFIILVTSYFFFYKYLRANGDNEKVLTRQVVAAKHGSTSDRSICTVVDTFTVVTRSAEINCSVKVSRVDMLSYLLRRYNKHILDIFYNTRQLFGRMHQLFKIRHRVWREVTSMYEYYSEREIIKCNFYVCHIGTVRDTVCCLGIETRFVVYVQFISVKPS